MKDAIHDLLQAAVEKLAYDRGEKLKCHLARTLGERAEEYAQLRVTDGSFFCTYHSRTLMMSWFSGRVVISVKFGNMPAVTGFIHPAATDQEIARAYDDIDSLDEGLDGMLKDRMFTIWEG